MITHLCRLLGRVFPRAPQNAPANPRRLVLILPCCIGDVIIATATLSALRRAYPQAHITWAIGDWSLPAIAHHPALSALQNTGADALPIKSWGGFWRFVRDLRAGDYDLAVSLVRSPLMSLAVALSGIPHRAGLDSAGRGFGYNLRAPVDPFTPRHEGDIYLSVAQALGINTTGCYAHLPINPDALAQVNHLLAAHNISTPYLVVNPTGGNNPGMTLSEKRYPPHLLAALVDRLQKVYGLPVVIIGGPHDGEIVQALTSQLTVAHHTFVDAFDFPQLTALAQQARLYIGNDTGLTHLASASGAKTVMILGPSDPARYAPFVPAGQALALWRPALVAQIGVAGKASTPWDWHTHGITVDEAYRAIIAFSPPP